MAVTAEFVSPEKEAPSRSWEPGVQRAKDAAPEKAFDPYIETVVRGSSGDSAANALSVQPLRAPVLQRAQRFYGNRASQRIMMRARRLQRQRECGSTCAKCGEEEQHAVQRSSEEAEAPAEFNGIPATHGEPLGTDTRGPLEAHFGADLSDVRVHTSSEAADSASKLDAVAYTSGRDIYFAPGMYSPASDSGQRLLAHEVAHVVQQGAGKEPTIATKSARGVKIGAPDDPLETEADREANEFMSGALPAELTEEERREGREAAGKAQRFIQRQGHPAPVGKCNAILQRQSGTPSTQPSRPDTVPGLGPVRTQDIEDLIKANDFQGAIDTLVGYKYMDYDIDFNLLANKKMTFDPQLTADDAVTSMPSWDYISGKAVPPTVRIGPSAFSSVSYLYSVIMHEYQHVLWQQTEAHQQLSNLTHQQGFESPDEIEAGAWELLHATESGLARLPDKVAQIWEDLNKSFWRLAAQEQASERPLVVRAFQKAKDFVKGSPITLVPFNAP